MLPESSLISDPLGIQSDYITECLYTSYDYKMPRMTEKYYYIKHQLLQFAKMLSRYDRKHLYPSIRDLLLDYLYILLLISHYSKLLL